MLSPWFNHCALRNAMVSAGDGGPSSTQPVNQPPSQIRINTTLSFNTFPRLCLLPPRRPFLRAGFMRGWGCSGIYPKQQCAQRDENSLNVRQAAALFFNKPFIMTHGADQTEKSHGWFIRTFFSPYSAPGGIGANCAVEEWATDLMFFPNSVIRLWAGARKGLLCCVDLYRRFVVGH